MVRRAKHPTLRSLADKQDVSVATLIDSAVREHGTVRKAARSLGVSPTSIYQWLSRHKYRVEVERAARIVRAQS